VLAQAALYIVLREQNSPWDAGHTTWTSLTSRRFGGDVYQRTIHLGIEGSDTQTSVDVFQVTTGIFNAVVHTKAGSVTFSSIPAHLLDKHTLSTVVENNSSRTTIISQSPLSGIPGLNSVNAMERLHIFNGGIKTTLVLPLPKWLLSLGHDFTAAKGALKAPMPSLIVEVKVQVGQRGEKGEAVVVIESMKTETVLRADAAGVVKVVGCKNGEMVEEGRELIEIEADEP